MKKANQYIIQHTCPNVQLLRVLCVSFQHLVRIVVKSELAIMSIDGTIQLKIQSI